MAFADYDYPTDHHGHDWLEPEDEVDDTDYLDAMRENYEDELADHGMPMGLTPFSLTEIIENCIEPTVSDGLKHIGKLIIWCIIFRITTQTVRIPLWLSHCISIISGILVLAHFFYTNTLYVIALSALSYLSLVISHKLFGSCRGLLTAITCVVFNTFCELRLASPTDWHQIRGAQMILSMKVISLGFDLDAPAQSSNDDKKNATKDEIIAFPNILEHFGYALNPGSCVLGPWVKYSDYLDIFNNKCWNLTWLIKIAFSMMFGFMFLTISTCWNAWLIPDDHWIWYTAYRDAMSFRASHYFVSFVSEASGVAAGFGRTPENHWNLPVTQPHNIEVPRSLVEVVVFWNVPMHQWLKTYCFKNTIKYGAFVAVLTTYSASTLLHGLNFQLAAVLLSLGFFTYTEHTLRRKMAGIFNASIAARRENGDNYRHKEGEFLVMVANLAFGLLAIFNLAYLGVMFDQQEDLMAEGYSWRHTLSKWEQLGFASHWVMGFIFVISFLV